MDFIPKISDDSLSFVVSCVSRIRKLHLKPRESGRRQCWVGNLSEEYRQDRSSFKFVSKESALVPKLFVKHKKIFPNLIDTPPRHCLEMLRHSL